MLASFALPLHRHAHPKSLPGSITPVPDAAFPTIGSAAFPFLVHRLPSLPELLETRVTGYRCFHTKKTMIPTYSPDHER